MIERPQGDSSPALNSMDGHWIKIAGVMLHHFALAEFEVTMPMMESFAAAFPGDKPCVLLDTRNGRMVVRLMSMKEAEALAEEAKDGGSTIIKK